MEILQETKKGRDMERDKIFTKMGATFNTINNILDNKNNLSYYKRDTKNHKRNNYKMA